MVYLNFSILFWKNNNFMIFNLPSPLDDRVLSLDATSDERINEMIARTPAEVTLFSSLDARYYDLF